MKYLIIRNDDVGFFTNMKVLQLLSEELFLFPQTYGIIPYSSFGGKNFFVCENNDLINYIDNNKMYKALHGIIHDCEYKDYEFVNLKNKTNIIRKLNDIKMNPFFDTNVFIPPHNYMTREWYEILKRYEFNIFSGTKREFFVNASGDLKFKKVLRFKCGVIHKKDYIEIPQGIMIKRKKYYSINNYFNKLQYMVHQYYQSIDILVITIHWWDFIEKGTIDYRYLTAFKNFLNSLYEKGVRGISFEDASKIFSKADLPCELFDIGEK